MATVSTLTVVLRAQTSAFGKRIARARKRLTFIQRQAMATRKALSGMFVGVIGAAGVAGVTMLGKKFVEAASFAQESGNRFKEVFKLQARAAEEFANKLATAVGRSKTNLKDMMGTLQDTFVPLGIARKKGAELSGQLVKLAIDVASFKDVADEKVLEDFTGALVGQSKAVLKYGIVTNIGALKQELLRQGIKKTFEALTTQEKVMLRFAVIMRSTRDAQGDAIRTAGNHANMVKRMKSAYEELQISLGKKMMPTMTKLVGLTIKAIAFAEKLDFAAIESFATNAAVAAGVLGIAKAFKSLKIAMNSALAKRYLWSGGMKLLISDARIWTKYLMANVAAVNLLALAIAALTLKLAAMHQEEMGAVRNAIAAEKRQKESRKRILADSAARIAARRGERFEKGSIRGQLRSPRKKTEEEQLAIIKAGKKLTEEMQSPLERFRKQFAKVKDLLSEGVISWKTYGRAVRDAGKTFVAEFKEIPIVKFQIKLRKAGKSLTEGLLTPMERFKKRLAEINQLFKAGAITRETLRRAIAKAPEGIFPSRPTSDFGVLPGPSVSIKGLSIGGAEGGIQSELQRQTGYLAIIAGKEALG